MPYINTTTTVKISAEKEELLKMELGKLIEAIPGKSEEWLMLRFEDESTLYFKGEKCEYAAFVNVKLFGTAARQDKNKLAGLITQLLENELSIPGNRIYITIDEVKDWAFNGNLF